MWSSNGRPTICNDSGRPDDERPLQTDIAGLPVRLNARLKNACLSGVMLSSPIGWAGQRAIGITRTSTSRMVSASSATSRVRSRLAFT